MTFLSGKSGKPGGIRPRIPRPQYRPWGAGAAMAFPAFTPAEVTFLVQCVIKIPRESSKSAILLQKSVKYAF
jgi:hypothetical protein